MGSLDVIVLAGTLVPHWEQKLSSGETSDPHVGQERGRVAPHLPQKLLPPRTSTPHPGHCKSPHPLRFTSVSRARSGTLKRAGNDLLLSRRDNGLSAGVWSSPDAGCRSECNSYHCAPT